MQTDRRGSVFEPLCYSDFNRPIIKAAPGSCWRRPNKGEGVAVYPNIPAGTRRNLRDGDILDGGPAVFPLDGCMINPIPKIKIKYMTADMIPDELEKETENRPLSPDHGPICPDRLY